MKITKFGHSCLLVEEADAGILIDPGMWSVVPPDLKNIDAILITHEHGDHFYISNIKNILKNNPGAKIFTNPTVVAKAKAEGVVASILKNGEVVQVKTVSIKGFGEKHAFIYKTMPICDNVGFIIAGQLFHPGDSYELPEEPVAILALPLVAPWTDLAHTLEFGIAINPKIMFPIHDGFLVTANPYTPNAEREFKAAGLNWEVLNNGEPREF
ncbi:MAG: MBL fold metallo-hydrolase [Candidatus Magasanikbacteria bacterium]|nr:MBL fold metallo-hydrolase [Candidatus Magasanikbacteria bacterium]